MAVATQASPVGATGALLSVQRASVRFGTHLVLDRVDLEVHPGELVALAGENGAGKSTLVRCIAGDIVPDTGVVLVGGRPAGAGPAGMSHRGVAVVWQDLALCDNLDVASNLMLGRETGWLMRSPSRLHRAARELLAELGIPLRDTTQGVHSLSGGQRQLLAVARAMRDRPRLLVLDEPTAALGVAESQQVEELTTALRQQGVTALLVSHDVEQMFRLADRIVVLRRGRVVGDVRPERSHPDEVTALITGQEVDASARRQLDRLHGLVDRLASADPGSSVSLILSALATALRGGLLALHILEGDELRAEVTLGIPPGLRQAWDRLPLGPQGGPAGLAATSGHIVVDPDVRADPRWAPWLTAAGTRIESAWALPIQRAGQLAGVITVLQPRGGQPRRDELDLVSLYAGHLAGALEREHLLGEVTARNRVLESIRDVLQSLAGPEGADGFGVALEALRAGLEATEVGLLEAVGADGPGWRCRVAVSSDADAGERPPAPALRAAAAGAGAVPLDGRARSVGSDGLAVSFPSPTGAALLVAVWEGRPAPAGATALLEDAGSSLHLALEREEAERAHQETVTLRRSQGLQRQFLSRLSHELRTPLTAIRGYASSLLQTDVTWDGASQERFLGRIAAESARLGRLVDDLLDYSAIESSVLRLNPDWCDLPLVLDAAVACVAPPTGTTVEVDCAPDLPVIWADHDRLEQVFVNLLDNAVRHNPVGTHVRVRAEVDGAEVVVTVADDGLGAPPDLLAAPGAQRERRTATSGAGLGLSIAWGIIATHGGRLTLERPAARGTCFRIAMPIERPGGAEPDDARPADQALRT